MEQTQELNELRTQIPKQIFDEVEINSKPRQEANIALDPTLGVKFVLIPVVNGQLVLFAVKANQPKLLSEIKIKIRVNDQHQFGSHLQICRLTRTVSIFCDTRSTSYHDRTQPYFALIRKFSYSMDKDLPGSFVLRDITPYFILDHYFFGVGLSNETSSYDFSSVVKFSETNSVKFANLLLNEHKIDQEGGNSFEEESRTQQSRLSWRD